MHLPVQGNEVSVLSIFVALSIEHPSDQSSRNVWVKSPAAHIAAYSNQAKSNRASPDLVHCTCGRAGYFAQTNRGCLASTELGMGGPCMSTVERPERNERE